MARTYRFTDKNHPPVPELKVGDRCYKTSGYNTYRVSVCEVRKVVVSWVEADNFIEGDVAHWRIDYYIRTDVDNKYLKSFSMSAFGLDDEHISRIYLTPQETVEEIVRRFKESVCSHAKIIQSEMMRIGYTKKEARKALGNKIR